MQVVVEGLQVHQHPPQAQQAPGLPPGPSLAQRRDEAAHLLRHGRPVLSHALVQLLLLPHHAASAHQSRALQRRAPPCSSYTSARQPASRSS